MLVSTASITSTMRQITIGVSLFALLVSAANPAMADREGVPGRRVGGGTRWATPRPKQVASVQGKLSAMTFASRVHLPMNLKLKIIYG